jgi:FkbM family methyltransferase
MNYSQNNEQEVILNYFKGEKGTFLDLGANDGITLSNTRALFENGWCGILVEPSPRAARKLKELYAGSKKGCVYIYECAIGINNGKATLHESGELLKKGDVALVSSLVKAETKRFSKTVKYEDVEVSVYRWKTFLNRLYIKKFDFISIDVEGLEIEILEQMDLSEVNLICVETNGDLDKKSRLEVMLPDFKIIYTSAENLIFAR